MSIKPPAPPVTTPKNVLVAEDNDTDFLLTRRKLIKIFSPEIIERAANRRELCASLLTPRDLIVADLHLGDIEEGELVGIIEKMQPQTPLLILTGTARPSYTAANAPNMIAVVEKGDLKMIELYLRELLSPVTAPPTTPTAPTRQ